MPRYKAPRPAKKSHGTAPAQRMQARCEIDDDQAIVDDGHDKYACDHAKHGKLAGGKTKCYPSKMWHRAARHVKISVHVYYSEDRKVLVAILADDEHTRTPLEGRKYPGGHRPVIARNHGGLTASG